MSKLRIIGDCHGAIRAPLKNTILSETKNRTYRQLTQECEYSVQVGDLGFNVQDLEGIDYVNHRYVMGNHDYYDENFTVLHSLGDYGFTNHGGLDFFFVRGETSIDKENRTPFVDWWPNEELNYSQAESCIDLFAKVKPDVVISHGCPLDVLKIINNQFYKQYGGSFTTKLLQTLFEYSAPKLWLFGHYHADFNRVINGCNFICINELRYVESLDDSFEPDSLRVI